MIGYKLGKQLKANGQNSMGLYNYIVSRPEKWADLVFTIHLFLKIYEIALKHYEFLFILYYMLFIIKFVYIF